MIKNANKIIKVLFNTKKIIHLDGEINQIIDIINAKTTYSDIFQICDHSFLDKNDVTIIKDLLLEKNLLCTICEELLEKDEELKKILDEFLSYK